MSFSFYSGFDLRDSLRFTSEISPANPIGFTDFTYEVKEGSKSEILRRCESGASNENRTPTTSCPAFFAESSNSYDLSSHPELFTSSHRSYKIRFRGLVKELSIKHEMPPPKGAAKKRTYEDSFGSREYDIERYGQEITANYFETYMGHAVMG